MREKNSFFLPSDEHFVWFYVSYQTNKKILFWNHPIKIKPPKKNDIILTHKQVAH